MKHIGLFEAKTKLSEICDRVVTSGEPVTVTRRGKPLVRIEPVREVKPTLRERRATYFTQHPEDSPSQGPEFEVQPRSTELPRDPFNDGDEP